MPERMTEQEACDWLLANTPNITIPKGGWGGGAKAITHFYCTDCRNEWNTTFSSIKSGCRCPECRKEERFNKGKEDLPIVKAVQRMIRVDSGSAHLGDGTVVAWNPTPVSYLFYYRMIVGLHKEILSYDDLHKLSLCDIARITDSLLPGEMHSVIKAKGRNQFYVNGYHEHSAPADRNYLGRPYSQLSYALFCRFTDQLFLDKYGVSLLDSLGGGVISAKRSVGCVYAACCPSEMCRGRLKIGMTSHPTPHQRMKSLRTGHSEEFDYLLYLQTDKYSEAERLLHGVFSEYNIRSEWFEGISLRELEKQFRLVANMVSLGKLIFNERFDVWRDRQGKCNSNQQVGVLA